MRDKPLYLLVISSIVVIVILALLQGIIKSRYNEQPLTHSEGIVTITFDDGYLNQYKLAFKAMKKRGFKGTLFVITGLIGELFEGRKLMGLKELQELLKEGWDIGSHTVSHSKLTTLAPEALEAELLYSKRWIEEKLKYEPVAFAYPYGMFNEKVARVVAKYYVYGRTGECKINEVGEISPTLGACSLWQDNVDYVKYMIDLVSSEGGWLIIVVHGVVESEHDLPIENQLFNWITLDKFEEILDHIKARNLRVMTFKEVFLMRQRSFKFSFISIEYRILQVVNSVLLQRVF